MTRRESLLALLAAPLVWLGLKTQKPQVVLDITSMSGRLTLISGRPIKSSVDPAATLFSMPLS